MGKEKYIIDFTGVNYCLEMHFVIRDALKFPDYYGCNWSAFWDSPTDMYGDPIHIEILGLDVIEQKFDDASEKMISILKKFKHFNNDLFAKDIKIEIVEKSGRKEIR